MVSLLAAACTSRSELGFATLMSEVPATRAIIVPPPGGPSIVAVLQRGYQNGVSQEIALSTASLTPGQNAFYVSLASGTAPQSEIDDVLSLPPLTEDRIQKEMEERLPGIEMQTSLVYVQNKYGPFGFATGRSASGDVCLYAWQRIEPNEPAVLVPGGTISVRLRLCDVSATPEQLLRSMYGFTIS
ncbi:MAG TPA: cellulose biosynthesis protein BcsN, partial [Microvirga sp.]|nr:cellulose biosynthesis protein BcsN [Microvirga sp.]